MVINSIPISKVILPESQATVDLLRLDLIHPTLSGNKFFKLKYNLQSAITANKTSIVSVGGPYSNHLHAMAYACNESNMQAIGLVPDFRKHTPTTLACEQMGMQIKAIPKACCGSHQLPSWLADNFPGAYFIPMGGENEDGIKGCAEICQYFNHHEYQFICSAIGTGTTMMGIARVCTVTKLLGIAALKDFSLREKCTFAINFDYTFGGFAKANEQLLAFMNSFFALNHIELDRVYTAKLMYALDDLFLKGSIAATNKVLAIHTGGLQGNCSLV